MYPFPRTLIPTLFSYSLPLTKPVVCCISKLSKSISWKEGSSRDLPRGSTELAPFPPRNHHRGGITVTGPTLFLSSKRRRIRFEEPLSSTTDTWSYACKETNQSRIRNAPRLGTSLVIPIKTRRRNALEAPPRRHNLRQGRHSSSPGHSEEEDFKSPLCEEIKRAHLPGWMEKRLTLDI